MIPIQDLPECTTLTSVNSILKYFGKPPVDREGMELIEVLDVFRSVGLKTQIQWEWSSKLGGRGRLRHALDHLADGVYFLSANGHSMALIDKELVDVLERGGNRKVVVYKVFQ